MQTLCRISDCTALLLDFEDVCMQISCSFLTKETSYLIYSWRMKKNGGHHVCFFSENHFPDFFHNGHLLITQGRCPIEALTAGCFTLDIQGTCHSVTNLKTHNWQAKNTITKKDALAHSCSRRKLMSTTP